MDKSKFKVGKTYLSRTNPKDAIDRVTNAALQSKGGYICVTNMRMVRYSGKVSEYNQLMKDSLMNWPDGKPLTWCARMWGLKDVDCTRGPNTFKKIMESGNKKLKHFFFGDTQEVLNEMVKKYRDIASIAGFYSPPFKPLEEFDLDAIERMIRESGANIVWTAMTAPKQDYFNQIMAKRLPDIVFVGVGRAFRMSIGKIKDAPEWAQKMGMSGVFIGRSKWYLRIWHYICMTKSLMLYFIKIIYWRVVGKKYYE